MNKSKILCAAAVILVFACNNPSAQQSSTEGKTIIEKLISKILPPLASAQPEPLNFTFDNHKGSVIETQNGSIVMIPEDAFVNADGSPVKGKVTLKYKEIFTVSAIILSGIPMNVQKKDGTIEPFISDGMFDIKAEADGKELRIAQGKELSVATPSNKTDKDFDYWYFNEKTGVWDNLGHRDSTLSKDEVMAVAEEVNSTCSKSITKEDVTEEDEKVSIKTEVVKNELKTNVVKPKEPVSKSDADFIFNIAANYEFYPELKSFGDVMWTPLNTMTAEQQIEFGEDLSKPGANVKLEPSGKEDLVFKISYSGKSIEATPVLSGKDLANAKAQYKEKMKTYNKSVEDQKKIAAEIKRQISQMTPRFNSKAYSLFSVASTGVYNCDKFYSYKGKKSGYICEKNGEIQLVNTFAILRDNKGVIGLSPAYMAGGRYQLPTSEVAGFINLEDDGTAFISGNDPNNTKSEIDLKLEKCPIKIESELELKQIIQTL